MKTQQRLDQENNVKTAAQLIYKLKLHQQSTLIKLDDKLDQITGQDLESKFTRREIADLMVELDEMQENMVYELNQIKDQLLRSLI
jgi:hypothetical protein